MYPSTPLINFIFFLPFLAFAYLDHINTQKTLIAIIDNFQRVEFLCPVADAGSIQIWFRKMLQINHTFPNVSQNPTLLV
jgi:hypothetical protein